MLLELLTPGSVLIIGGLLMAWLNCAHCRSALSLLLPVLCLVMVWRALPLMGATPFTPVFATVFCLAAFAGGIFALGAKSRFEVPAAFIYAGSAVGVTFAQTFLHLFIFWEVMAIASTAVILTAGTDASRKAAFRYAIMHGLGGVLLLAGIAALNSNDLAHLSVEIEALLSGNLTRQTAGAGLILLGVLMNAAAPPFSAWLPDAYPEASPSGTVFLSAFTTKTAVFVLLTLFPGTQILIPLGLYMVFYGIIYAMLENDVRRILSYSVVNQIGFMMVGIGIGTPLALAGVATHAFCHIVYKALLFMSAGAVLERTGKRKCTDLGGLWYSMKFTAICGIIGALAISAFPLTSGFVSKSMLTSAAAYEQLSVVWFLLITASAGAFLYIGIRFPWFVFFQKDSGMRPEDAPLSMKWAMGLLSLLCLLLGVLPGLLYNLLPEAPDYQPYTAAHIIAQVQLLLFAGLAFFILLPWFRRTNTITLDTDWLWRVAGAKIIRGADAILFWLLAKGDSFVRRVGLTIFRWTRKLHGPSSIFGKDWEIGSTMLYASVLLAVLLAFFYS